MAYRLRANSGQEIAVRELLGLISEVEDLRNQQRADAGNDP